MGKKQKKKKSTRPQPLPPLSPGNFCGFFHPAVQQFDWVTNFLKLFAVRLLSVFLADSEFVPDEGWQSLEVARWFVYGDKSGFLTWEWVHGLRSFLYPLLFVPMTCIFRALDLQDPRFLMYIPRLFQALLTTFGECSLIRYSYRRYGGTSAKWVTHLLMFNWFMFYCATRNLSNNVEMALGLVALDLLDGGNIWIFTAVVGINFCVRPTSILMWLPMVKPIVHQVLFDYRTLKRVLMIAFTIFLLNTFLDRCFYGAFTFPWWNFLKFNVIDGRSADFGIHPYSWYMYSALPSMLGVHLLWVLVAAITFSPRYIDLVSIIAGYVVIFSTIGHKEIRFMLPILPLCIVIAGDSWNIIMDDLKQVQSPIRKFELVNFSGRVRSFWHVTWSFIDFLWTRVCFYYHEYFSWTKNILFVKMILTVMICLNLAVAGFLCGFHQVGIKPATGFISQHSRELSQPRIWVLMPCFSFPVHTYLNRPDAEIEYFTCTPPGLEYNATNAQEGDFTDIDLTQFVQDKMRTKKKRPHYVMVYDHTADVVKTALKASIKKYEYGLCHESFHTPIPFDNVGKKVQVLC